FSETHLDLPTEVLVTVMRKHQRYLPVRRADGGLLPHFVAVANGECDAAAVTAGNEAVLRARYEDAGFFWRGDLAIPPVELRSRLSALTFEERLGSMADRAARIATIAGGIGDRVRLVAPERAVLQRACTLAKFDLASQMVIELPSLAGVMAREYARAAGEPEAAATALFEMELPRSAGDDLPVSLPGAILALADRLDLLAGLFAVGASPTGSSDPFGLRRAALGVIGILRRHQGLTALTVSGGLGLAGRAQPVAWSDKAAAAAAQFVTSRVEQQMLDAGTDHRLVQAVLPFADNPGHLTTQLEELARSLGEPWFKSLCQVMQRIDRIVPAGTGTPYEATQLSDPAEVALHETVRRIRADRTQTIRLDQLASDADALSGAVERFFVDVLVMADDPLVRAARLGLLASVRSLGECVGDWSALG
ncbi:MAG: glycine--tRNA ligase subunit beta, partial [Gemmatimonadales bacterium]